VDSAAGLDERVAKAYLAAMTSRLLLTLLALLTGLAAQTAPAEARMQSARGAEMSAAAALVGEVCQSIPAGFAQRSSGLAGERLTIEPRMAVKAVAPTVPAVFTGVDRAHE